MNDLERPHFYWIPEIVAAKVNPHESFVFSVVYWFTKLKEGRCYASNQRIADALPYPSSPTSVANALQKLEEQGFILRLFRDAEKRVRSEVVSLVDVSRVSPTGEGGITHRLNRVSPTGEQNKKREKEKKEDTSERSSQEIVDVINAFSVVNTTNTQWYRNTTQRGAASRLTAQHTLPVVLRVIALLPQSNGRPYFPTITTPLQLEQKWSQLEAAFKRFQTEVTQKQNLVI